MSNNQDAQEYIKTLEQKVEDLHKELTSTKAKLEKSEQRQGHQTQLSESKSLSAGELDGSKPLDSRLQDEREAMASYIENCDFDFVKKLSQEQEEKQERERSLEQQQKERSQEL